ncbi:hypothetical protein ATO4_25600 [Aurantimonas sp. 22II-16-19i]|nr:hypothetical protein ATO4_25600 [Aurantimonas sp. 22II-16-19i]
MTKRIDVVICEFNRLLGEGIASLLREAGYDPMIIDLECYNFSVLDVKHDRVLFLVGDLVD